LQAHYLYLRNFSLLLLSSNGSEIYVPLRIIQNGDGAEVLLTLFRQQDMTDAKFIADAEWVERDPLTLKALAAK